MAYDPSLCGELEMVPIPDDTHEPGVEAGTMAVVVDGTVPGLFVVVALMDAEGSFT